MDLEVIINGQRYIRESENEAFLRHENLLLDQDIQNLRLQIYDLKMQLKEANNQIERDKQTINMLHETVY